MLEDKQREEMKKQRLDHYDRVIFGMEMDLTAAVAAGENSSVADIQSNIDKMKKAREAVENM